MDDGRVQPEAVGTMDFNIMGRSRPMASLHYNRRVGTIPSCDRVLYSQQQMRGMGIQHHLDDGYLILPDGSYRSVSSKSYTIEMTFGHINRATAYTQQALSPSPSVYHTIT